MAFPSFSILAFQLPAELELLSPVWSGRGHSIALLAELLAGAFLVWCLWAARRAPRSLRLVMCIAIVAEIPALNFLLNLLLFAVYAERARGTGAPFW